MTNDFLLLGKMFAMLHANIFTDEIVNSILSYLFVLIKFGQVQRAPD